jgi:hypothetical protein
MSASVRLNSSAAAIYTSVPGSSDCSTFLPDWP